MNQSPGPYWTAFLSSGKTMLMLYLTPGICTGRSPPQRWQMSSVHVTGEKGEQIRWDWTTQELKWVFFPQLLERSICSLLTLFHPNLFSFVMYLREWRDSNMAELMTLEIQLTYLRANLKVILSQSFPEKQSSLF